jgi:hypothetical protein
MRAFACIAWAIIWGITFIWVGIHFGLLTCDGQPCGPSPQAAATKSPQQED